MKVAFHKNGQKLGDKIIKWWDAGPYSHCEIVFDDGLWVSASLMDGACVRGKYINPTEGSWDYLDIPDSYIATAQHFFSATVGMKYDLFGLVRFIVAPFRGAGSKFWCSEWVAGALGMQEPWRYGPNGLHAALLAMKAPA